jgi:hypothetical protein
MSSARTAFAWIPTLVLVASAALATGANPPIRAPGEPRQTAPPSGPAVTAIVVRSWGTDPSPLVWEHLNQHWALYGSVPIHIDYTTLRRVDSFTLADLEALGADVVIVSDPSGGTQVWTPAQVSALDSYARQGHNLVGTYLLLQWGTLDNRILAPLWGLRADFQYTVLDAAATTPLLVPSHCLFTRLDDPLHQGGWPYAQTPLDGSWDPPDLAGAGLVARSPDGRNIVTEFLGPGYRASYISYMPEYQDGSHTESAQYLYNAIVCVSAPTASIGSTWGRLKRLYR